MHNNFMHVSNILTNNNIATTSPQIVRPANRAISPDFPDKEAS